MSKRKSRHSHSWHASIVLTLSSMLLSMAVLTLSAIFWVYQTLPDVKSLLDVSYQEPMRIYTADGELIAEYGKYRRVPIKYEDIPKPLIQAIIATEDQRFFQHGGIDFLGMLRAVFAVLKEGDKVQGASTITMQVARNFFLDNDKTFVRKFKEILLSFEIELYLSKQEILELYCNQIFFGRRAYGIAAAADIYYGKAIQKLSIPELAMLAGIPQAPSKHNPIKNEKKALARRNHVLERMYQMDYINENEYKKYIEAPNTAVIKKQDEQMHAMHVADLLRQYWVKRLGEDAYTRGLVIRSTLKSAHQKAAHNAVVSGMHAKRGIPYQAPFDKNKIKEWLRTQNLSNKYEWGVVTQLGENDIEVLTQTNEYNILNKDIHGIEQIFIGAVVPIVNKKVYQWPLAESALVNIEASTGEITALVGGVDWRRSHFNRAVQAMRQSGSTFKPLLVTAALRQGYKLKDIMMDEPFVAKIPGTKEYWRPMNDDKKFKGPMTLREAVVQSRNLVMVHLLSHMDIDETLDLVGQMGLTRANQPRSLSMSLGAGVTNPIQLSTAFGIFINRGSRTFPHLMISVVDQTEQDLEIPFEEMAAGLYTRSPDVHELAEAGLDPNVLREDEAWSMLTVLQDVVKYGTARRALSLNRSDVAGKTGTSNNQNDVWFVGVAGKYVASVWCGYDQLKSLNAYGASLALPIWIDFMSHILKNQPLFIVPKPEQMIEVSRQEPSVNIWMNGHEHDDWVDPDEDDIVKEIL